eukprot:Gb_27578 [translate_table: standard]
MDNSRFDSNSVLERSGCSSAGLLPKDWLHLRPPCPTPYDVQPSPAFIARPEAVYTSYNDSLLSKGEVLTSPVGFQDVPNHTQFSAFFGSLDCYPLLPPPPRDMYPSLYPPLPYNPKLGGTPFSCYEPLISLENPPTQNKYLYPSSCPLTGQGFVSGTTQFSSSDGTSSDDDISENGVSSGDEVDYSDAPKWPEFKETIGNLSFEGTVSGKLCKADKFNASNDNACFTDPSLELTLKTCGQQKTGNSSERSMLLERAQVPWQEHVNTAVGADHSYFEFACSSCGFFSRNYCQENFEANAKLPPPNMMEASVESVASAFGEALPYLADTSVLTTNHLVSKSMTSSSTPVTILSSTKYWGNESNSENTSIPNLSNLTEFQPTTAQELRDKSRVSEGMNSPRPCMEIGDIAMDDIDPKHQKSTTAWSRSTSENAVYFSPIEAQANAVMDIGLEQAPSITSRGLLTVVDMSEISKSVIKSERKQDYELSGSSEGVGGRVSDVSKTVQFCSSVQNGLTNAPVLDIFSEDWLLPTPNEALSFSSNDKAVTESIPRVIKGSSGCEVLEPHIVGDFVPCKRHGTNNTCGFPQSGSLHEWPGRLIDDAVAKSPNNVIELTTIGGPGYLRNMCTMNHIQADPMTTIRNTVASNLKISEGNGLSSFRREPVKCLQSSFGSVKHDSKNPELGNFGSDFPMSFIDRHTLVQTIYNSSQLLIGSSLSGPESLAEPDVQALQSVICNLSQYLVQRAGLSALRIQAASQLEQARIDGSSEILGKGFELDGSCYREDGTAHDSMPKGFPALTEARGIFIAEETPYSTQFLKEYCELQKTDSPQEGLRVENIFSVGEEKQSKRTLVELQNLVEKLREDFMSELEERDTSLLLYKNLWSDSQAALDSMKSEMKHIKTELEVIKQSLNHKDVPGLSVIEGKTSENNGSENYIPVETYLNTEEHVLDRAAILLSRGKTRKDLEVKMNLNSLMDNNMPHADAKGTFCERAAILLSREKSLGDSDISTILKTCGNDTLHIGPETEAEQRGDILARFRVLQECYIPSDMKRRDSCKPLHLAVIDEPGLCNYSLDVDEDSVDELECYESNLGYNRNSIQGEGLCTNGSTYPDTDNVLARLAVLQSRECYHRNSIQGEGLCTNESANPDTDNVQTRLAVLQSREASQVEIKGRQGIFMSNRLENQLLCPLTMEETWDVLSSASDTGNLHGGLEIPTKIPMLDIEQIPHFVPSTDCSLENKLPEGKGGKVSVVEEHSQILFANTLAIQKVDSKESIITMGIQNQRRSGPSEGCAEAESHNGDKLGNISHDKCEHESVLVRTEGENSSTESDSSWEHVVKEEDIMLEDLFILM